MEQQVTKVKFREGFFFLAAILGRNDRMLPQSTQPTDQPVNIYHPNGEYLKGFVCE